MTGFDRRAFVRGAFGAGLAAGLAGCTGALSGSSSHRSAFGIPAPQSGPIATAGTAAIRGAKVGLAEVNADRESEIDAVLKDGQGSPETALTVTRDMVADDVPAITGTLSSDVSNALSDFAEDEQVPFLTAISGDPAITSPDDDYTFRMTGNDVQKVRGVMEFLKSEGCEGVAVVAADYSMGRAAVDVMNEYADQYGLTVEHDTLLPLTTNNFLPTLRKIDQDAVDALFVPFPGGNGPTLLSQVREQGLFDATKAVVGNDSYGTQAYREALGADLQGVYNWGVDLTNERANRASEAMQERFGVPMDALSLPNYDAVHLLADAVERAGSFDPAAIRDALADADFETASGWHVTFDESGDVPDFRMLIGEWQREDGQLRNRVAYESDVIQP